MAETYYRPDDDYEYDERYYERRGRRCDDEKDKYYKDKDKDKDMEKDKEKDKDMEKCKDKDKDKDKDKNEKTFLKELEKHLNKKVEVHCGKQVLVVVIVEVAKDFVKAIEICSGKIIIFQAHCISYVEMSNL